MATGPVRATSKVQDTARPAQRESMDSAQDNGSEQRREPRFKFDGATILVFDDAEERRTVAVTHYYNVSRRGACVLPPATGGLTVGSRLTMLPQPYLEKREVVVVNRQEGTLHLELPDSQEFSEFEVAEMIRAMPRGES